MDCVKPPAPAEQDFYQQLCALAEDLHLCVWLIDQHDALDFPSAFHAQSQAFRAFHQAKLEMESALRGQNQLLQRFVGTTSPSQLASRLPWLQDLAEGFSLSLRALFYHAQCYQPPSNKNYAPAREYCAKLRELVALTQLQAANVLCLIQTGLAPLAEATQQNIKQHEQATKAATFAKYSAHAAGGELKPTPHKRE